MLAEFEREAKMKVKSKPKKSKKNQSPSKQKAKDITTPLAETIHESKSKSTELYFDDLNCPVS